MLQNIIFPSYLILFHHTVGRVDRHSAPWYSLRPTHFLRKPSQRADEVKRGRNTYTEVKAMCGSSYSHHRSVCSPQRAGFVGTGEI